MFESAFERWMNTPANPAVTSSDAGISPTSSRLRALIAFARQGRGSAGSSGQLSQLGGTHQVLGVLLRAQVVVQQRPAAIRRNCRGRDAGDIERLVQMDPCRQVIRQP